MLSRADLKRKNLTKITEKFDTRYHFLQTTQSEPHCAGRCCEYTIFGGSCRVTFVVAFSFCSKILRGGGDQ